MVAALEVEALSFITRGAVRRVKGVETNEK